MSEMSGGRSEGNYSDLAMKCHDESK